MRDMIPFQVESIHPVYEIVLYILNIGHTLLYAAIAVAAVVAVAIILLARCAVARLAIPVLWSIVCRLAMPRPHRTVSLTSAI